MMCQCQSESESADIFIINFHISPSYFQRRIPPLSSAAKEFSLLFSLMNMMNIQRLRKLAKWSSLLLSQSKSQADRITIKCNENNAHRAEKPQHLMTMMTCTSGVGGSMGRSEKLHWIFITRNFSMKCNLKNKHSSQTLDCGVTWGASVAFNIEMLTVHTRLLLVAVGELTSSVWVWV